MRVAPLSLVLLALLVPAEASAQRPDGPLELAVVARVSGQFALPPGSERAGFDVDVLRRFAAWHRLRQGREVRLELTYVATVPEVLAGVEKGADVGLGGITATAERDRTVDFSAALLPVRSVLVAPAGSLEAARWRQQLKGRRLGATVGSTNAALAARLAGEVGDVAVDARWESNAEVFAALAANPRRLDAAVVDLPQYWTAGKQQGLALVDSVGEPQEMALVLREGSPLKRDIDRFLDEFTHTSDYFQLVRRYFGSDAEQMVRLSRGG